MTLRLAFRSVSSGYFNSAVIREIDFEVHEGEVVALLGPNGAGKTTTLLTAAGVLPPLEGEVWWNGETRYSPLHHRVRAGLGFVSEERSVFMSMTTHENLRIGRGSVDQALKLFPELVPRLNVRAGLLSGGEQQMLALARTIAAHPTLLLVDELSLGLAPLAVERLLTAVRRAATEDGTAVILVEQNLGKALSVADRAFVMTRGRIRMYVPKNEFKAKREEIIESMLGGSGADGLAADSVGLAT